MAKEKEPEHRMATNVAEEVDFFAEPDDGEKAPSGKDA